MAAFEFRPSSLTLAVAAAIFLPKQAYAPTEFSFENTYAGANGSIGREIITWPVSGGEPVRWPLAPTEENLAPFLWVEMQQQEGVFDAQTEQDSDDSDKDDDKDDDNATPGEAEPYMRPAIKTTTKAAAAPSVAKSKRASSDSLLKKTLISTARKTSATNLAPPYPTNAPFRAKKPLKPRANAQPFHLASRSFVLSNPIAATEDPFARSKPRSKLRAPLAPPPPPQAQLPHRPATAARVLGSPFSASSDTPPLASLRASNAAAEAGAALKRSKPSSAWEGRLARIQRASMRLQRVIAESDDPHGIFGAQLRDIDLETGGIR